MQRFVAVPGVCAVTERLRGLGLLKCAPQIFVAAQLVGAIKDDLDCYSRQPEIGNPHAV
jgi:hypothetical protein